MALLTYGDVNWTFAGTLTQSLTYEPDLDPSRSDYQSTKITLEVLGAAHPALVSTNKRDPAGITMLTAGDRLPNLMFNLEEYLMTPRRVLTYQVANAVILESPLRLTTGERMTTDSKNGPTPEYARYSKIIGDKTGILHFRISTHHARASRFLTSLRWNQTHSIDNHGFSKVITRGRAAFRKDFLAFRGLQPDDFRPFCVPIQSNDLRRVSVDVVQDESAGELDFTVVDTETRWGLGESEDIQEVLGTVTSAVDTPIKDIKSGVATVGKALWSLVPFVGGGLREFATTVWSTAVPSQRHFGVIRVIGRKGTEQARMARVARDVITDRFQPVFTDPKIGIAGMTVVASCDSDHAPFVEVRIDILGLGLRALEAMFARDPTTSMNLKEVVVVPSSRSGSFGPAIPTPRNAATRSTRGTYWGRMVAAALMTPARIQNVSGATAPLGSPVPDAVPPYRTYLIQPLG